MKKFETFHTIALLFFFSFFGRAQAQVSNPFVSVSAFADDGEPYVEMIFLFKGNSLVYTQNNDEKYVATLSVKVDFLVEKQLFLSLSYAFSSKEYIDDNRANKSDILQLETISVPNNIYEVQFTIEDINSLSAPYVYTENVNVDFSKGVLSISDINLYQTFGKNPGDNRLEKYDGYFFIPLYKNEIPAAVVNLSYSYEVYYADVVYGDGKNVFINTMILNYENDFPALPSLQKIAVFQAKPKILCVDDIDISKLPSGNYFLVVKIMDNHILLKEQRRFFTNINPFVRFSIENYDVGNGPNSFAGKISHEKLIENILQLAPISTQFERDFFKNNIAKCSLIQLQNYFYSFWYQRDSENPEQAWKTYQENFKKQ